MLRTCFWYAVGWSYLLITLPLLLRVKYLEKRNRNQDMDRLTGAVTRTLARHLFYLTGSRIKITGEENIPKNQPVLFVSNHQSHIDNIIIHGFINKPKGFVSIIEAKKIPVLRTWMEYLKCVFLDRSDSRQMLKCINRSISLLKQGHSMVIYPEGKLSAGETVAEFKKGSLRLAIKAGVPIVPITLRDSYKVMAKDGSWIRPAAVECIISEPIQTSSIAKEDEKSLTDSVRRIIADNI